MAITAFNGGEAWYPWYPLDRFFQFNFGSYVIDASGEIASVVFRSPVAGTIDKFGIFIQTIGNTPDNGLKFSLQSVDASTGVPTGTILESGNATSTIASGSLSAATFNIPGAFTTSHTATRGELMALVVGFASFVAGDSVTFRDTFIASSYMGLPYGVAPVSTKIPDILPIVLVHYTDNGGFWQSIYPQLLPASSGLQAVSMDTGTTPDEAGAVFIPSQPCRLDKVVIGIASDASGSNFDVIVYDGSSNILDTVSYDGDQWSSVGSSSFRLLTHILSAALDLTAGSTYRIAVLPTTTNNVSVGYYPIPDSVIEGVPGKMVNLYYTERTNAGSWTNYNSSGNYRYPMITLGFSGFDAGGGSSGGGIRLAGRGGLAAGA